MCKKFPLARQIDKQIFIDKYNVFSTYEQEQFRVTEFYTGFLLMMLYQTMNVIIGVIAYSKKNDQKNLANDLKLTNIYKIYIFYYRVYVNMLSGALLIRYLVDGTGSVHCGCRQRVYCDLLSVGCTRVVLTCCVGRHVECYLGTIHLWANF